jgi:hypothetical protein
MNINRTKPNPWEKTAEERRVQEKGSHRLAEGEDSGRIEEPSWKRRVEGVVVPPAGKGEGKWG